MASLLDCPLLCVNRSFNSLLISRTVEPRARHYRALVVSSSSKDDNDAVDSSQTPTRFVTFLGKGGSGKTTAAVFAAQHYAMTGLSTCLIIHNQDPTAEYLLGHKIGTSPTVCDGNLSAMRLKTTKMLLEPLNRMKQADSHLNMTQGVLEGVVGEELGVLPGMDSIFSMLELEKLVGFINHTDRRNRRKERFDVVIYDGISTEETLRMIGVSSKARLYLKYLRSLAEKTDLGRLAGPSIMRLVDETMGITSDRSPLNGNTSAEIWDSLERLLERGASIVTKPSKFSCFLMMDPENPMSIDSALRYWGCTIQAGANISAAFALNRESLNEDLKKKFLPLPFASVSLPHTRTHMDDESERARNLLSQTVSHGGSFTPTVKFDVEKKSVTLFMPGFDKSEIKLYQYRGGSELLVEAGDQRRVIHLPTEIQGKVGGAKFIERNLVVTMR